MQLVSVNVSPLTTLTWNGHEMKSGIRKQPIADKVWVDENGLAGDAIGDKIHHGGTYKAVYSYASEHYDYWREILKEDDLPYGLFGENLDTEGLDEASACIGDHCQLGEVILEVVQPRHPCRTLGFRFQDMGIIRQFLESGRHGIYYRVVQPGFLQTGDAIKIVKHHPARVPLAEINRLYFEDKTDVAGLERILAVEALPPEWREQFGEQLSGCR